jgi:hypothetical protein
LTDSLPLPDLEQSRQSPRWGWPTAVTLALDLVAVAASWAAYLSLQVVEALMGGASINWRVAIPGLLVFAVVLHVVGVYRARRLNRPWVLPAFVVPLVVAALMLFGFALASAVSIPVSMG